MPFVPMRSPALKAKSKPVKIRRIWYKDVDITEDMIERAVWFFVRGLLMSHGNTHPIYVGNIVQDPWTDAWFAWQESERVLDELLEEDE